MTVPADAARRRIVEIFTSQEEPLLRRWSQISGAPIDELRDLHQALRTALVGDADLADVRGLLGELSRSRARQGYTPSDTARVVFSLKEAVYEQVEADGQTEALRGFAWLSRLIDDLGLFTFETYSAAREKIIIDQAEQLLELSTPVVKLWEGIVAVPLVGTLDSARTQVVMEKLLQTLVDTGSEHAVIDITGVPAVDTEVAQHLLKTVVAARLMGAECVISGIRPQIAHTIVTLGIEFGDIVTKASLADALAYALTRSGVQVKGAATTRVAVRAERG
ncbi:STAS domain-containing protein [Microbispora triticiradicis]|uniref:STAS domain-containing protein n=3 Tax=Microbispora TaxID=2005 RepID=A0ABY3M0M0_9ACTN|nr:MULTISPECIES: STAS domain-containing protein [Microbispora]RGA06447.1 STAS domain-containing protein [Microbispora triticiradicis]TLP62450.1 STAS domain-containing protein [Microbispora fusca]TYB62481.1 STAS domain-containing protein [Microbispora tritici]GLW22235.1 polyvinylalcohol dehydrogenase [Microbispora amethystogenes]